jgi:hypothetical protein
MSAAFVAAADPGAASFERSEVFEVPGIVSLPRAVAAARDPTHAPRKPSREKHPGLDERVARLQP